MHLNHSPNVALFSTLGKQMSLIQNYVLLSKKVCKTQLRQKRERQREAERGVRATKPDHGSIHSMGP